MYWPRKKGDDITPIMPTSKAKEFSLMEIRNIEGAKVLDHGGAHHLCVSVAGSWPYFRQGSRDGTTWAPYPALKLPPQSPRRYTLKPEAESVTGNGNAFGALSIPEWKNQEWKPKELGGASQDLDTWLITIVSKSPKWGYSPYKWLKWLINGGLLTTY